MGSPAGQEGTLLLSHCPFPYCHLHPPVFPPNSDLFAPPFSCRSVGSNSNVCILLIAGLALRKYTFKYIFQFLFKCGARSNHENRMQKVTFIFTKRWNPKNSFLGVWSLSFWIQSLSFEKYRIWRGKKGPSVLTNER